MERKKKKKIMRTEGGPGMKGGAPARKVADLHTPRRNRPGGGAAATYLDTPLSPPLFPPFLSLPFLSTPPLKSIFFDLGPTVRSHPPHPRPESPPHHPRPIKNYISAQKRGAGPWGGTAPPYFSSYKGWADGTKAGG